MRPLVPDRADDAGLRIAPLDSPDPGGAAQRRERAIGGGEQGAADAAALGEGDGDIARLALRPGRPGRRQMVQVRQRANAREEGAAQDAVLDDVAERVGTDLAVVVMEKLRRVAVGDPDLADRLGLRRNLVPGADAGEDALRAEGDCRSPSVERLADDARRILAVDDRDVEPGAGAGGRQGEADEAAADDDQLAVPRAGGGGWDRGRNARHGGRMGRRRGHVQPASGAAVADKIGGAHGYFADFCLDQRHF